MTSTAAGIRIPSILFSLAPLLFFVRKIGKEKA
jgi:hypothetical protein